MPSDNQLLMENEIIFEGNRLEDSFSEIPGQWQTIWLFNGSTNNKFNHTTIKNSTVGILCDGNQEDDNKLENKRIVGIVCQGAVDGQFEGQSFAEKTSQLIDNINIPEDIWENEINNDKVNLE